MTPDRLRQRTRQELLQMAKRKRIRGYSSMTKDELIRALVKTSKNGKTASSSKKKVAAGKRRSAAAAANRTNGTKKAASRRQRAVARNTQEDDASGQEEVGRSKYDVGVPTRDLSRTLPRHLPAGYQKDRIVVMVRDPYWLHCYWELTRSAIRRAEAALGQEWHTARPIVRLVDVTSEDTTSAAETVVRDIEIHGGCNNWYIDVTNPPRSYRVDIGYLSRSGRFYVLARSNVVTTPRAGVSDVIDENWADVQDQYEKIYAMSGGYDPSVSSLELKQLFEERLRRPMGSPAVTSFGSGAMAGRQPRQFWFQLDAELIVYGSTEPKAKVTLQGDPVQLRSDGTFTMRFSLPDGRQIIPAVATSKDGIEERTIVLAVERNTKELEPVVHDGSEMQ